MSAKKLITVIAATGRQGGSIIDTVLSRESLSSKYALRGVTRDPSSAKAQALTKRGVEMVTGDVDDLESIKRAVRGSYGVYGVTDFWSTMDGPREIQQGKNIFHACQAEGVTHLVFSALPSVIAITHGRLSRMKHFETKAEVQTYMEANKASSPRALAVSYFLPAMFLDFFQRGVQRNPQSGKPTLAMPFQPDGVEWPLLDAGRDTGKYVLGLFERGPAEADGVAVRGVSTWTTPDEIVGSLSKAAGEEVVFYPVTAEQFKAALPPDVADELLETVMLVGEYAYYGKGSKAEQAESDKYLIKDADLISMPRWAEENGPWKF